MLDAVGFSYRNGCPYYEALSIMWGAVANLGMRWKAFASADFLLATANYEENMLLPIDAQMVLRCFISGTSCEWANAQPMPPEGRYWTIEGSKFRHPDPWGFGKGKGGGISFNDTFATATTTNGSQSKIVEE